MDNGFVGNIWNNFVNCRILFIIYKRMVIEIMFGLSVLALIVWVGWVTGNIIDLRKSIKKSK